MYNVPITMAGDCSHLDFLPKQLLSIIEPPKVLILPEQLNRRLGSIPIQLGHVQVIHKEHHMLACRGTFGVQRRLVILE